jgi:uncharacterized metal-binding protein YceD (DUF177 family)
MSDPAPEFSRPVPLARLGSTPFRQEIEATASERQGLARRFDLLALDRLRASVTLRRRAGDAILLEAVFEAAFAQTCVLTLEPVPGEVSQSFALVYGPPGQEQAEIAPGVEEPAFEPLIGDSIDIGEAVAQELSLALPDFPRRPDAVSAEAIDPATAETIDIPYAELTRVRDAEQS